MTATDSTQSNGKEGTDSEKLREKADRYAAEADALEALRDELAAADSIGETRLSELFHETRTNRRDVWDTATAFLTIDDGKATVEKVKKLREGRWTPETRDRYDAVVSVPVREFMDSETFRSYVRNDLRQVIQGARANEQQLRAAAKRKDCRR